VSHNIGNSVAEKRKLAVGSGIRTNIGRLDLILDYILGESDHWQVFPYILEEDHLRAASTDP